jgi:hypothetical protein
MRSGSKGAQRLVHRNAVRLCALTSRYGGNEIINPAVWFRLCLGGYTLIIGESLGEGLLQHANQLLHQENRHVSGASSMAGASRAGDARVMPRMFVVRHLSVFLMWEVRVQESCDWDGGVRSIPS